MYFSAKATPALPYETFTEARRVYNIQHIYLRIGDQLEAILSRIDLTLLDPSASRNSESVLRLALATAFQYAELLPDPLASQATLKRMDWKYALRLPVKHPGLSVEALCEFRRDLHSFSASAYEFTRLLGVLGYYGLFSKSASQTLNAAEAISTVCKINRFYQLQLELRAALSTLAVASPDWLNSVALPHWYERYRKAHLDPAYALVPPAALTQEAESLGADAFRLLDAIKQTAIDPAQFEETKNLARTVAAQFQRMGCDVHWQLPDCASCPCRV